VQVRHQSNLEAFFKALSDLLQIELFDLSYGEEDEDSPELVAFLDENP